MTGAIVTVDENNFNSTIMESQDVWLVEFYDPKCSHCKAFAPIYEEVAANLEGKVKVAKMDGIHNWKVAYWRFNVTSYPTVFGFRRGVDNKKDDKKIPFAITELEPKALTKFGTELAEKD